MICTQTKMRKIWIQILNRPQIIYWFVFRPKTRGVKCVVECDKKILLVKLSYAHKGWTIPGGGVGRKETFEDAARRELKEETGIVVGNLKKIDEYLSTKYYKRDIVQVFYSKIEGFPEVKIDNLEVSDYLWFDPENQLPNPHSTHLPEFIQKLKYFSQDS